MFRFKIAVMAQVTPAEKAKRYREKNKVREQEALREKLRRVEMKVSNPEKNKARLLKENCTSGSIEKGFSQRSSEMRSVRKAEKSLPRSPRKRNAVASSLAKKFQLRILPQHLQGNRR